MRLAQVGSLSEGPGWLRNPAGALVTVPGPLLVTCRVESAVNVATQCRGPVSVTGVPSR